MLPRITVITACHNQASALRLTIDSVISQEYPNLEHLIVVSKTSEDDSLAVATSLAKGAIVLQDNGDAGPEGAVNQALGIATGEVFALLGAGDFYFPGTLLKVANHFFKQPNCHFFNGRTAIYNNMAHKPFLLIPMFPMRLEYVLYGGMIISTEGTFWTRSIFQKAGFWLSDTRASDYDLWVRLLCHLNQEQIGFTPDVLLSAFCLHSGQRSGILSRQFHDMVKIRDARLIEMHLSKPESMGLILHWTKKEEDILVKLAKELKQPYIFIPLHSDWFCVAGPLKVARRRISRPEPDMLRDLLPEVICRIKHGRTRQFGYLRRRQTHCEAFGDECIKPKRLIVGGDFRRHRCQHHQNHDGRIPSHHSSDIRDQ